MSSQRRIEDGQQVLVPGLDGHVGHPGLQVQGPDGVALLGDRLADRQVVLQVALAAAGVPGQAVPALVDELLARSR